MTSQARARLDEAEDWYRKALTISQDLGDPMAMAKIYQAWQEVTGQPVPQAVRDYVASQPEG